MLRFNERVLNDEVIHTILVQKKDILKLIDLDINVPISILSTLKLKDGEFSLDDYMEFFDLEEISFFASFNWLIDYDTYKNFSETELEIAISKVQKIINELEMDNVYTLELATLFNKMDLKRIKELFNNDIVVEIATNKKIKRLLYLFGKK